MIAKTVESTSGVPVAQFLPDAFKDFLDDKIILIVGGSNGIGASLVELCCQNGAHVVIGDIDAPRGEQLARKCIQQWPVYSDPALPPKPPRAFFQKTDVTNYQSVLDLFDNAFKKYNRIDHVVVTAGSTETDEPWFDHSLSLTAIRKAPSNKDIDVNLIGTLYVTRVASVYLRHNRGPGVDRSILLFSCAAGFKETPGVSVYQAAKHGVQGLMRSLRANLNSPYQHSIRINTICPWMTQTGNSFPKSVEDRWAKEGLPLSTAQDVAKVSAGVLCDNSLHGTSMYVEGTRAWEIENNIDRLESQWLGEEPSQTLAQGQKVLRETLVA
ncbi:NAD(P)-binding protein [Aspergillus cavernicola]|uniref:NAD(P)-binding protein n=1 Tax=Aspergillus cavernicola TaxID=176166 RepID=A0ABR4HPU0_9EURO